MIGPRITWVFVGVGIIAIVFYAGYQARYVIGGPTLSIKEPKDGEVFSEPLITVSGYAKNTTLLSLNGRTIFTDEEGNFSAPLLLHAGHTIIEVRAENRFGRVHAEYREVVHEGKEMLAPSIDTNARATESAPNEKKTPH